MEDSLQQQLQQAMSEFTKQREALVRVRDEVMALSVTMRSKDRAVEVTVGVQGEPTGLRFLNNRHQSMSGQQLATSVLEVMAAARQKIAGQAAARFEGVAGSGIGVAGTGLENLDLDRLLDPLASEGLLATPDAPQHGIRSADDEGGRNRA